MEPLKPKKESKHDFIDEDVAFYNTDQINFLWSGYTASYDNQIAPIYPFA